MALAVSAEASQVLFNFRLRETSPATTLKGVRPLGVVKVREIIKEREEEGWTQIRQTGSHHHFKHDEHSGSVCVAGNLGDEVPKGTLSSIVRQAGLERRPR